MANKEAFLNNIAKRLGRSRIQDASSVKKPIWHRHPWDHLHQGMNQAALVDQHEAELTKLGGEVIRVPAIDQLPNAIQSWLDHEERNNIVSWDHDSTLGQTVTKSLHDLDSSTCTVTMWQQSEMNDGTELHADEQHSSGQHASEQDTEQEKPKSFIEQAEQADVGFVVAEYGLSETGTVVLFNRGANGRLVSLLPTAVAVVLSASTILPRLTDVLPKVKERALDYSCINLITGPSRSADIEMDLSIGVHGPGQISVFLIEDHLDAE